MKQKILNLFDGSKYYIVIKTEEDYERVARFLERHGIKNYHATEQDEERDWLWNWMAEQWNDNYKDVSISIDPYGKYFAGTRSAPSPLTPKEFFKKLRISVTPKSMSDDTPLLQQFANLFVNEPYKTLRKLGVVDDRNRLTADGKELYEQWRFQKDVGLFKEECADAIIKAQKEAKKAAKKA